MKIKIMALGAAALALAGAGAAHADDYGRPPYASGAYGYAGYGGGCGGLTLAGAQAGVTVLGISVGGGAALRIGGGDCPTGYSGAAYAPPPPPPAYAQPVYQGGYQGGYQDVGYQGGGYSGAPSYPAPVAYPPPGYGYAQSCGCQGQPPTVYQPY